MNMLLGLLLLLGANGAPIIAENVFGKRYGRALDGGIFIADGKPLFGHTKTVRGIVAALFLCGVIAVLFGEPVWLGVQFGAYAMLGDLISSFIKRRLAIPASGKAIGLDQIPESLLPLWMLHEALGITLTQVVLLTAVFFLLEIVLSKWLYRWHIRKRPY